MVDAFFNGQARIFYCGASECGHALDCVAAVHGRVVVGGTRGFARLQVQIPLLSSLLDTRLRPSSFVYQIRQCGCVAGSELGQPGGRPLCYGARRVAQVRLAAREFGLLKLAVLDTLGHKLPTA